MNIAFVSNGTEDRPRSSAIRSYRMALELRKRGHNTEFFPDIYPKNFPGGRFGPEKLFLRRFVSRTRQLRQLQGYDIVYINKYIIDPYYVPPVFTYVLKNVLGKTIVLDTCDPIWDGAGSGVDRRLELSDAVVVSGPELATYAGQFTDSVSVVPMSIDTKRFRPRTENGDGADGDNPVVGWVGHGPNYKQYIERVIPVLERLAEDIDFTFFLTSAQNDSGVYELFDGVGFNCDIRDWVPEGELVATINTFDVGMVPLRSTEWARGKSPIKILEYNACGVPVVASNVGDTREMVEHGKNGFLAEDEDEWYEYLRLLLTDEGRQKKMGKQARQQTLEEYSYAANAERLETVLADILS